MTDQQTQWQHCHEEANRLRRELKALNANRATLTDPAEIEEKIMSVVGEGGEMPVSADDEVEIIPEEPTNRPRKTVDIDIAVDDE